MKIISVYKSKDQLGNNTTVAILKSSFTMKEVINYLETTFSNTDHHVDEINQYGDGDKMYQAVFLGNVKF